MNRQQNNLSHTATREIRDAYDRLAPWYNLSAGWLEVLGVRRLRRQLFAKARGRVLEIAAGTGRNFRYYPPGVRLTAVDLSFEMLRRAPRVDAAVADAERVPFKDGGFDTVVSALALCTYPDPLAALREMARLCRPGGRVLLLEHGRSRRPGLARWQDRHAAGFARLACCHWNREPLELARAAGLDIRSSRRRFLGIFHLIEAAP